MPAFAPLFKSIYARIFALSIFVGTFCTAIISVFDLSRELGVQDADGSPAAVLSNDQRRLENATPMYSDVVIPELIQTGIQKREVAAMRKYSCEKIDIHLSSYVETQTNSSDTVSGLPGAYVQASMTVSTRDDLDPRIHRVTGNGKGPAALNDARHRFLLDIERALAITLQTCK